MIFFGVQVGYAQELSFGIKAGGNYSNTILTVPNYTTTFDFLLGFHAGVYLKATISGRSSLQTEAFYSRQGYRVSEKPDDRFNLHYIMIPVLFRYDITKTFNVHAGPQYGFLVSADRNYNDSRLLFTSGDLGIVIGVGMDISKFTVGFRFVKGLSNIAYSTGFNATMHDQAFQFYFGYKLLGK